MPSVRDVRTGARAIVLARPRRPQAVGGALVTCPRCNGWFYRDFDGLTCALCARPAVPVAVPEWLREEDPTSHREQSIGVVIERQLKVIQREAASVASVTYDDMRAAMAGLR